MEMSTFALVVTILLVVLFLGLVGSAISADIGNTCDLGIGKYGSIFCWKWHQNAIGDVQENFNDLINK